MFPHNSSKKKSGLVDIRFLNMDSFLQLSLTRKPFLSFHRRKMTEKCISKNPEKLLNQISEFLFSTGIFKGHTPLPHAECGHTEATV